MTDENVFDLLYAANLFDFHEVSQLCGIHLNRITNKTIFPLLDVAVHFGVESLVTPLMAYFENNFKVILEQPYEDIDHKALKIITKNTPTVTEDIFAMCVRWARAACHRKGIMIASGREIQDILGDVLDDVSMIDLPIQDLHYILKHSGMYTPETKQMVLRAIQRPGQRRKHAVFISGVQCGSCSKLIPASTVGEWVECRACPGRKFCLQCVLTGQHDHHERHLHVQQVAPKGRPLHLSTDNSPHR